MSNVRLNSQIKGGIRLWQFLVYLLDHKKITSIIQWTNRQNLEFKLVDPEEVARQWGTQKKRPKMNYEYLSRSLRYYYEKNIMQKVSGERYVYRFICDINIDCDMIISNSDNSSSNNTMCSSNSNAENINKLVDDILLQSRKPLNPHQKNAKFIVNPKIKQQQQGQEFFNHLTSSKTRYLPYHNRVSSLNSNNNNYELKQISLNTTNQVSHQLQPAKQNNYYPEQHQELKQYDYTQYDDYSITSNSSSSSSHPSISPQLYANNYQTQNYAQYNSTPTTTKTGFTNFHDDFHVHPYHMYAQQQDQLLLQQQHQHQQNYNNTQYPLFTTTTPPTPASNYSEIPYYYNNYQYNGQSYYLPTDTSSSSSSSISPVYSSMNLSNCQTPPKTQQFNYY